VNRYSELTKEATGDAGLIAAANLDEIVFITENAEIYADDQKLAFSCFIRSWSSSSMCIRGLPFNHRAVSNDLP